ncbi:MAG: Rrf2 family transcriptional regulator, partial [Stellaceae bacterium]
RTRCLTHDLWEELGNQIRLYLSSVTLADVVANRLLGRSGALHRERADQEASETAPTIAAQ